MIYELVLRNFDCSLGFVFSLLFLQPFNFSPVSFACNFQDWGCVILREIDFLLKICSSIPCLHPSWEVHILPNNRSLDKLNYGKFLVLRLDSPSGKCAKKLVLVSCGWNKISPLKASKLIKLANLKSCVTCLWVVWVSLWNRLVVR